MMQETIDNIIEKINFKQKDLFKQLLTKCVQESKETSKSTYAEHENIIFKVGVLFKGFMHFTNELGKDFKYESGVEALSVISEELGIELEKSEFFILFHIKDIGKFRLKEVKLHKEMKELWHKYKHYKLEDQDFSRALKNLMRAKFIEYRKGTIQLNDNIIIRYKTGSRK